MASTYTTKWGWWRRRAPDGWIVGGIAAVALLQVLVSYLQASIGRTQLVHDVTKAWRPLMDAVLHDDVPLYTQQAVDNKPPLFQYLNLTAGLSGEYILAFYAIIGICNAAAAILLYRWVRSGIDPRFPSGRGVGVLAAILFLGSLPLIGGTHINARSPMFLGVLAAVQFRAGWMRGAAIAGAALCSQYAILGAPVLAYDGIRQRAGSNRCRWVTRFTLGGVGMVAIAFLPLFLIWGWPSVAGGVIDGLFSQYRPVTSQPAANVLVDPYGWGRALLSKLDTIWFLLIPAGIGLAQYGVQSWTNDRRWYSLPVALLAVYLLPLAVKSLGYYFLHMAPFAAAIGGVGVARLVQTHKN